MILHYTYAIGIGCRQIKNMPIRRQIRQIWYSPNLPVIRYYINDKEDDISLKSWHYECLNTASCHHNISYYSLGFISGVEPLHSAMLARPRLHDCQVLLMLAEIAT